MTTKTLSLVVTGMHRSGTTWIGKVVDKLPEVTMLDEPFNAGTGLRGVRCFYLDPSRPDDVGFLNDALDRLENGTAVSAGSWSFGAGLHDLPLSPCAEPGWNGRTNLSFGLRSPSLG